LMREDSIKIIRMQKYKATTDSNHTLNIAPNPLERDLAISALDIAVTLRQPPEGCIHHTDRGSRHCSHDDQKRLL
jgi:putative transposase